MRDFIEINLVYKNENDYHIEKVYASKVGDFYRIESIPAFATNVAYGDLISAEIENGDLFFDELKKSSGHSVVQIVVLNPQFFFHLEKKLLEIGVNINYLNDNRYLVLDVPPNISYPALKFFLENEFRANRIDYREACISNQHKIFKN